MHLQHNLEPQVQTDKDQTTGTARFIRQVPLGSVFLRQNMPHQIENVYRENVYFPHFYIKYLLDHTSKDDSILFFSLILFPVSLIGSVPVSRSFSRTSRDKESWKGRQYELERSAYLKKSKIVRVSYGTLYSKN